jgi:hypothetical protein
VGFFTNEEYATNPDGMVIHDGTWTYKIPTVDTIPKQFNVELINSARDQKRLLSSKGDICFLTMFHPLPKFLQTVSTSRELRMLKLELNNKGWLPAMLTILWVESLQPPASHRCFWRPRCTAR